MSGLERKSKSRTKKDSEESDLEEYKPKISCHSNYQRFLYLTHGRTGSLSEDEGSHSGGEGFIEDEFSVDDSILEEGSNIEEDLYPELSSPGMEGAAVSGGDATAASKEPTEEQKAEWQQELEKVEGEIATLRQVLGAKVRYVGELKRKLGITPLQELKQDFQMGVKTIRDSDTYQKTSAAAKSAAEKTSSVVSEIGTTVSKKLGDIRNSQTFKSVEGKVESAYATVRAKVSGSKSEGNFEDALESEKAMETNGNTGAPVTSQPLPEEKVPL